MRRKLIESTIASVKLNWHDGVLSGLEVVPRWQRRKLLDLCLNVFLYRDAEAATRELVELIFESVESLRIDLDAAALQDNALAGHIVDAELRRRKPGIVAIIRLTGGSIRIDARQVKVADGK